MRHTAMKTAYPLDTPLQSLMWVLSLAKGWHYASVYDLPATREIVAKATFERNLGESLDPLEIACIAGMLINTAKHYEASWGLDMPDLMPASELTGLGAIYFHMENPVEIAIANQDSYNWLEENCPELFTGNSLNIRARNEVEFGQLRIFEAGMPGFYTDWNGFYRMSEVITLQATNLFKWSDTVTRIGHKKTIPHSDMGDLIWIGSIVYKLNTNCLQRPHPMWFWDINYSLVIMLLCLFIVFPAGLIWSWLLWRAHKQKSAVQKIAICILYYAISLWILYVSALWLSFISEAFPILRYSFSAMNGWYSLDLVSIFALLFGFIGGYGLTRKIAHFLPERVGYVISFVFLCGVLSLVYATIHTECRQELKMLKFPSEICKRFPLQ